MSSDSARAVTILFAFVLSEVTVVYQNSLPVISVKLPSRRERCQFTLKPLSDSVGVFLQQLQAEDRGIDRVAVYSTGMTIHTHKTHPCWTGILWNPDSQTLSNYIKLCFVDTFL